MDWPAGRAGPVFAGSFSMPPWTAGHSDKDSQHLCPREDMQVIGNAQVREAPQMKNEVLQHGWLPSARHFLSVGTGWALLIFPPAVIYPLLLGGGR